MRNFIMFLSLFLGGQAFAQELPPAVAEHYLAFEAAIGVGRADEAAIAAEAAWEEGERIELDAATLAMLADNAAHYAIIMRDFDTALRAQVRTAQLLEQSNGALLDQGSSWRRAAELANLTGQERRVQSYADNAVSRLERVEPSAERDNELLRALGVSAHHAWRTGSLNGASRYGRRAFEAFERSQLPPSADSAMFALYVGVKHANDRNDDEAAYWLAAAHFLGRRAELEGDTLAWLEGWDLYARGELLRHERRSLLLRLSEAGYIDAPCFSDCEQEVDAEMFAWSQADQGERIDTVALNRVPPEYPFEAVRRGIQGTVLLRFDVDENGDVQNPEVVFSIPSSIFEQSAIDAVLRWEYEPASLDGEPVYREGVMTTLQYQLAN